MSKKTLVKKKLEVNYDKKSKGRPAWIQIKGLPDDTHFIKIHLGKKGKQGKRIQFYKTHLPPWLFLPIDHTSEEMKEYYNKLSKIYDKKIKESNYNIGAGKFLCNKLKKYTKITTSILDIGAGTGLVTEIYLDAGFNEITLIDYSKGMLEKAKKRKKLKNCKTIQANIKNLNLKKKYNIIISLFALGSSSYFSEKEVEKTLKLVRKHLNPKGVVAVLGHFDRDLFARHFKELESGVYTLDKKREFYTDYFIGRK
jgi:ubiquinone/menaquinone biosynthesis C-methylase UbiE